MRVSQRGYVRFAAWVAGLARNSVVPRSSDRIWTKIRPRLQNTVLWTSMTLKALMQSSTFTRTGSQATPSWRYVCGGSVAVVSGIGFCVFYSPCGHCLQSQMPRLTPYLSNGVFVISERGLEPKLERKLEGMLEFVPHNQTRVRQRSPLL
jgi:hypothetical protein